VRRRMPGVVCPRSWTSQTWILCGGVLDFRIRQKRSNASGTWSRWLIS